MLNEEIIDTMIRMAMEAMRHAYVRHTDLPVGASVLASDGTLYTGCTIDNASPEEYLAAEKLAVYKAVSDGKWELDAVAIVADTEKPYVPAGGSLQLFSEFNVEEIITANMNGDMEVCSLNDLFPAGNMIQENHKYNPGA